MAFYSRFDDEELTRVIRGSNERNACYKCVNLPVRDRGSQRALQDVRSSVKRINLKVRVRVRRWVEGNGAHVHVTVNIGLELLVEFGVKVGG
jgi:hypothetical protein